MQRKQLSLCQAVRACQAGLDTHDTVRAWFLSRKPDTSLTLALATLRFMCQDCQDCPTAVRRLSGSAVRTVKPGLNPHLGGRSGTALSCSVALPNKTALQSYSTTH